MLHAVVYVDFPERISLDCYQFVIANKGSHHWFWVFHGILKWRFRKWNAGSYPFLKPSEWKSEILNYGIETVISMKAVAEYFVNRFIRRISDALLASKILPFTAFGVLNCESLKAIVFCTDTKHNLGIKITAWNILGKCLFLGWIPQNLRIGNSNMKVKSLIVR